MSTGPDDRAGGNQQTAPLGFIGLGSMGAAIAKRLILADQRLSVFDVNTEKLKEFAALGATIAQSPRDVADQCEVVFSCLPTTQVSEQVALGPDGIAQGRTIKIYIETSTIGPKTIEKIALGLPKGIQLLDAPVSGGPVGAEAGTLSTIVSGKHECFLRAQPILALMAKHVFHVGERPGMAQIAKLINNHLSTAHRLATFEGLVLALKAGFDLKTLVDVINASSGRSYTTTDKIPGAILSGSFTFNGRLAISIKDQTLLAQVASELGVPLWVAPSLLETLKEASEHGYTDKDSMLLMQYMGEQAGIDVRAMVKKRD